jgi:predicted nucleic acid-binding protein
VRLVIDASIALKWVIPEPDSEAASALRHEELIAPSIWIAEAANALWRLVRLNELAADEAYQRLAELGRGPVASVAIEPHVDSALRVATEIRHPIYDCLYLAVALHYDSEVVTADRRFAGAVTFTTYADRVKLLGTATPRSLHEP